MLNEPLSASPEPVASANATASPASGSLAASVPTVDPAGWFSGTEAGDRARDVGASLTSATVTVNVCSKERGGLPLSVVRTRIEYEPLASRSNTAAVFSEDP